MSSAVRRLPLAAGLVAIVAATLSLSSCRLEDGSANSFRTPDPYPPPPQTVQVLALGGVRSGRLPSRAETRLAEFLFGAEPDAGIALVKPVSTCWRGEALLICDSGLNAVLVWDPAARDLSEAKLRPRPKRPIVVRAASDGDLLVIDMAEATVLRFGPDGALRRRYTTGDDSFRPAGVVCVGGEVWVSDAVGHRIVAFDGQSGRVSRTIGRRGPGSGQFGAPLGIAATPDGNVCVVDTLNNRVQLLDPRGEWVRDIGGPGNQVGRFGRPKDVAVGPDGVIFVTDAASQRVHAFDARGRALLAFGEPGSARADLSMPAGLCICPQCPIPDDRLPAEFSAAYYVVVAEQLRDPGLRVFAWRGRWAADGSPIEPARQRDDTAAVDNPHWSARRCGACHAQEAGRPLSIARETVDALCLSCHDGKKAHAEAHPIGRWAAAPGMTVPGDWPLVDGRIACLTCHDIRQHCDAPGARPALNPGMVREYEVDRRMEFCTRCHVGEQFRRLNPHVQLDAAGRIAERSCKVCHEATPDLSRDGVRRGQGGLRVDDSTLCLTCHSRHWDVSPRGHVDRPATETIVSNMGAREAGGVSAALPLSAGRVTCYTCHNPHQRGLFPPDSPLGARAASVVDASVSLRVDFLELCTHCHNKGS